jgi:hypothetical protein
MDQGSLVVEETDAGAEFVRRFQTFMPVDLAFWLKGSDDNHWTLCIASKQFDETKFDLGYGEVLRLAKEMKNPYIEPFHVMLLPSDSPLAVVALKIQRSFPGNIATRFSSTELGGIDVAGAYIYPLSLIAPSN